MFELVYWFIIRKPAGCSDQLLDRAKKVRMPEGETVGQQFAGYNAAALDQQFGFRAQEKCADFQEPARRRQAERSVTDLANRCHEFRIRHRVRRGEIRYPRNL